MHFSVTRLAAVCEALFLAVRVVLVKATERKKKTSNKNDKKKTTAQTKQTASSKTKALLPSCILLYGLYG
jgi:preprotein translocase subunit SecG